jgi:colicin import membrane protein
MGVVLFYGKATTFRKPADAGVTRVKLVELKSGPPEIEKVQSDTASPGPVLQEKEPAQAEVKPNDEPIARETVKPLAPALAAREVIPLKKRNRTLQRVELPKPRTSKQAEDKDAEKKPETRIEQRLAAIRQNVESRRKDSQSHSAADAPQHSQTSTGSVRGQRGEPGELELIRWLDQVRSQVNSHWSLLRDGQHQPTVTVIGVRISDEGHLIEASVEESSGDQVLDRSAMRAVHQAAPFPPIPPVVKEKIRTEGGLALRFTPGGIQ